MATFPSARATVSPRYVFCTACNSLRPSTSSEPHGRQGMCPATTSQSSNGVWSRTGDSSLRTDTFRTSRRSIVAGFLALSASSALATAQRADAFVDPHVAEVSAAVEDLALQAINAYNARDLQRANELYTQVIRLDSDNAVWLERRGQVLVDLKRFADAIHDFNAAEAMYHANIDPMYVSLGLLSNRALAHEGLYDWRKAIADYDMAIQASNEVGFSLPYVLNSRGNCHGSLAAEALKQGASADEVRAQWLAAKEDYNLATDLFQRSRNLSGAIFAASNAALISAQLGDDKRALKELKSVARRAPGSVDMRAAIAAIYYAGGEQSKAEEYWSWACTKINSGQLVEGGPVLDSCSRYADSDWMSRIRRWPPVMVDRMRDFIQLAPPSSPAVL